ncbi:hypothetical protein JTE90_008687 [Oedothorax gibbosus]|uniref:Uncharacterized protein n=1 Tax=Oedothorax gibbosus TaxID=931172 RepID=A0AAV6TI52_9ARAC|nr:hypothetical protein JTE90_008687 [Oedothorax gibbosus]
MGDQTLAEVGQGCRCLGGMWHSEPNHCNFLTYHPMVQIKLATKNRGREQYSYTVTPGGAFEAPVSHRGTGFLFLKRVGKKRTVICTEHKKADIESMVLEGKGNCLFPPIDSFVTGTAPTPKVKGSHAKTSPYWGQMY